MPVYIEKVEIWSGVTIAARTNEQTNKERQNYLAIGPWKAEMSNTFEGGPLVFLCVVKYKHMKFRKKIERHFFYDIDDDDDDDDESSHVKVSI